MKLTKTQFDEILQTKDKKESLFVNIFTKFIYNKIVNLYEDSHDTISFQKKLYIVPSWTDSDEDDFYDYFNRFVQKKYELSEEEFYSLLQSILFLNIQLMCTEPVDFNTPSIKVALIKLFKHSCKYFYENPFDLEKHEKINLKFILNLIKMYIKKQLPIPEICNVSNKQHISYDFNKDSSSSTSTHFTKESHKTENETDLKYINSEEYENEYYSTKHNEKEIKLKNNYNDNEPFFD